MDTLTTLKIKEKTHDRLVEVGKKSETFDHIINRALDALEKE